MPLDEQGVPWRGQNEGKSGQDSLCSIKVSGVGRCAASWAACGWLVKTEGLLPFECV